MLPPFVEGDKAMEKLTMQDYIKETPEVLLENIENYKQIVAPLINEVKKRNVDRFILVASGSSHNACYCARAFMKMCTNLEVKIITPYTFTG